MKSRWWIAASFLLALALVFQPGCDTAAELPSQASPDEALEDPAAGTEDPMGSSQGAAPAETPAETPKETPK